MLEKLELFKFNPLNVNLLLNMLPENIIIRYSVQVGIALAIFFFFWLFRNIFSKTIFKIISGFTRKTKNGTDDHLILSFERPINFFFILLGFYLALLYLPLTNTQDWVITKTFRSGLVILLSFGFYDFVGRYDMFHSDLEKAIGIKLDKILVPFFSKMFKVIIVCLAVSVIAQDWGFPVTSFVAGLGLGGLAFALAAKETVSNIFGGIVIITDKPFSIGDWIRTPSIEGVVEDINFRSTRIRTFAQAIVTVPNSTLANEPITNWSRMGKRRIMFNLGVTYNTPKAKIEKCISRIRIMLENHPEVHKETIIVRFDSFNSSSLDIFLYFFTITTNWTEYLQVKEDINFKIIEIFEEENVSFAFPSTSVYFETPLKTDILDAPTKKQP